MAAPGRRRDALPLHPRLRLEARGDTFTLDDEPISVPLSAGTEEISRIFNERAERRAATFRAGVEQAIRGHFTEAHAGPEPPERETW